MLPRPCLIVATILIASASALASATPPLRHQLPARATRLEFLGWSPDGQLFALRVQHARDMGELAGADQLVQIQVHDTLTAQMVTSFRIERGKDLREDNLLAKAWAEARPASEWKAYRSAVKLISAGSSLRSPDGWSLVIEPVNRLPCAGDSPSRAARTG